MAKVMLGVTYMLLLSPLGFAHQIADIHSDRRQEPLTGSPEAAMHSALWAQAGASMPAAPQQGMSADEKQRRKDECVRVHDHCYDWCTKTNKTRKTQEKCYRGCAEALADCMARIPD